jgi:hypothetical protein
MNPQEWQCYVNSGKVPSHFLHSMIKLIIEGGKLNLQHLAVYQSHGEIVEIMLKKWINNLNKIKQL